MDHGLTAGNVLSGSVKPPFSFQIHQLLHEEFPDTHTNIESDDDGPSVIPSRDGHPFSDDEVSEREPMELENEPDSEDLIGLFEIEEEENRDLTSVVDLPSVNHPNALLSNF